MICGQIVSRDYIHAQGRAAYLAGESRDSHHMNWHAAALVDWLAGWDAAQAETLLLKRMREGSST